MSKKIRKYTDEGWALWLNGERQSTLYLNEWINPNGKNFVDVSTRIYNAKNVTEANFFIPFHISESEITDLSDMLSVPSVLQAVFNTNGKVDTEKNKYTSELHYDERRVSLVKLSPEFVSVRTVEYGTVVALNLSYINEYITADEAYVSFRIPHKTLDDIFKFQEDVKSLFQKFMELIEKPVISEKFGYSLRINEARRLPQELNDIEELHKQRIKKALVTITISDEYNLNDSSCYRIRHLEDDLMENYMPEDYPAEDAITYQWVEEKPVDKKSHYNFYYTMERSAVSGQSLVLYIIFLVLIGMLGAQITDLLNFLIGYIFDLIKNLF